MSSNADQPHIKTLSSLLSPSNFTTSLPHYNGEDIIKLQLIFHLIHGFLFTCTILNWATRFQDFYINFPSFFQSRGEFMAAISKVQVERRNPSYETDEKTKNVSNEHLCHNEKGYSSLTIEDVEKVMEKLGMKCNTEGDWLKMCISSDELPHLFEEQEPSLEEVNEAFSMFDENGDGFIDVEELQKVLCKLDFKEGSKVNECERMIRAFDCNGDDRIDFNEFVKLMENSFC